MFLPLPVPCSSFSLQRLAATAFKNSKVRDQLKKMFRKSTPVHPASSMATGSALLPPPVANQAAPEM
jgi:hypothetical protein